MPHATSAFQYRCGRKFAEESATFVGRARSLSPGSSHSEPLARASAAIPIAGGHGLVQAGGPHAEAGAGAPRGDADAAALERGAGAEAGGQLCGGGDGAVQPPGGARGCGQQPVKVA